MDFNTSLLESIYSEFVIFLNSKSGENFTSFATSPYVDTNENYKYEVHSKAKEKLKSQFWKIEDIGTGRIQSDVNSAIQPKVIYNYRQTDNNLIDWRKKDNFSKLPPSKSLEELFFSFYKNKIKNNDAFDSFLKEGLSYQFIAYLFFIKDKNQFLPISQEWFDKIFELIGITEFKTSGRASWENYFEYCSLIRKVRDYLKTKDRNTTLLDAHSFLWIVGPLMHEEKNKKTDVPKKPILSNTIEEISYNDENQGSDEAFTSQLIDGAQKLKFTTFYERNPKNRELAIEIHGFSCMVCNINFEDQYGEIGKGFIHVHHINPVSESGEIVIDPKTDLVVLCPNCHSMIHRQKDKTLTVNELKAFLKKTL